MLAGKGGPLKRHGKQAEINGVLPVRRDHAQHQRSGHINENGPEPQVIVSPLGQPGREEHGKGVQHHTSQPQQGQFPVALGRAGEHFQQIHRGSGGKMPEPQHHVGAEPSADDRHAEMQPFL